MLGGKKFQEEELEERKKTDLFIMGVRDKDKVKGGTIRT